MYETIKRTIETIQHPRNYLWKYYVSALDQDGIVRRQAIIRAFYPNPGCDLDKIIIKLIIVIWLPQLHKGFC